MTCQIKKLYVLCETPSLDAVEGRGITVLVVSEPRFRRFWKTIRFKIYLHSNVLGLMWMSLFFILTRIYQSQDVMEETAERVNPMDLDPSISGPSDSTRSEHVSIEALLKIS